MPLKDIEPSIAERDTRGLIKASPICPWCAGPKEIGYTICWRCYNEAWKKCHA
jgi:hypothetical protein